MVTEAVAVNYKYQHLYADLEGLHALLVFPRAAEVRVQVLDVFDILLLRHLLHHLLLRRHRLVQLLQTLLKGSGKAQPKILRQDTDVQVLSQGDEGECECECEA